MLKKSLLLMLLMALLVPWAAKAQQTAVLNEGTDTGYYVPFNGNYADYGTKGQFIIPATDLAAKGITSGCTISKITLHSDATQTGTYFGTSAVVEVGEVSYTTFSETAFVTEGLTSVLPSGINTLTRNANGTVEIAFGSNYTYNGGNLLISIGGYGSNYKSTDWLGVSGDDVVGVYAYQNYDTQGSIPTTATGTQNFSPKVTITYISLDPYISLSPNSTTVFTGFTQNLTASYGNVSGTPTITYSSSNNKIASVSGSGTSATVTGESVGTATITATMTYNATEYTATCAVTVEEPSYCTPSFSDPSDDHITNFTTTGGETNINNSSTYVSGGYSDYYATVSASIQAGNTLTCTVTPSTTSYSYGHSIWVDWNRNYEFENDERVAYSTSTAVGDWTGEFEVPSTTAAGDYRLRVIHLYNNNVTNPCHSASYGEGEDYKLTVTAANPYQKPVNLQVSNLTAISATITWEAPNSDVQSYKYQYREAGGSWSDLTSTTALSAPLTVLTGNTTYEFQVQAIYAGNNESSFASTTFTTLIAIPYSYGFETAYDMDFWEQVDCELANGYYNTAGNEYSKTGDGCYYFSSYNGSIDPQYLISPQLSGIANGLHVSFYYRSLQDNDPETFMVGYSTTDKDPDSFIWSDEVTCPDGSYYPYAVNFMVPEIKYVAVKYTTADKYYLFVDDFTFEEAPNCLEPTGVNAINITTTTADITWTNGGDEDEWDIYATDDINDVPGDLTTPTVEGVTTKPYPLTLLPGTTYYVYVRAACSAKEHSAWSSPCSFHTDCEGMDLPYGPYGFEDGALTVCWNLLSTNVAYNTVSMNTTASYIHTGDYSLLMHSGSADGDFVLALPVIDDSYSLSDYRFVFWAMATNTDLKVTIGIMEDPNDMTTFVAQSEEFNPASTFTEYKVPFNGYSGDGHYVALKVSRASGSNYGNIYFDDIAIELLPSCIEPSGLTVSDETAHGATFSWTNGGSETEWHLYVSTENTAPADDIYLKEVYVVDDNPHTITTGLDPETDYYVWVRANCGGTDGYSMWVGPETFTTAPSCFVPTGLAASEINNHAATFTWTGTSESYIVKIGEAITTPFKSYDFEDGTISADFTNSATYPWTATAGGYNSSSYCAIPGNKGTNNSSSDLTLSVTGPATISFYAKVSSESGCDYGRFLIDGTQKVNISGTTSTWTKYEYDLTAGTHTLIWRYYKDVSMASGDDLFYVDDIIITKKSVASWMTYNAASSPFTVNDPVNIHPETNYAVKVQGNCGSEGLSQESAPVFFTTDIACPAPTGLTASNPKSNSFDLQWTNGGSEDWVLAYKVDGAADFTELDLNVSDVTEEAGTISYTLGGLDAETNYIVKVRDNCEPSYAGDGVSEWTAEVPYSTIAACSAMNPVVSNVTHHNATVTWEGESADGFTVKYRTAALVSNESPVFSEQFNTSSSTPPTGWTRFRGLVDKVIDGTATLTTTTSGWYCDNTNALATLNIYGTSVNYWLVTPEVTLTTDLALSFDMALTDYGNANALDNPTAQLDDRFVVLVFADDVWHILREWNNSGSAYVYNNIATTGEKAVIDLSDYDGETVKIAFYGESTANGGDNDFHIDNVLIGTPTAAGDWNDIPANTTTAEITGLTAGTLYDVKVVTGCTPSMETEIISINTVSSTTKHLLAEGNWNDGTKWMDAEFPTTDDIAILHANVTIPAGTQASVNSILIGGTPEPAITIKDGGELYHTTTVNRVTMEKVITGATTWGEGNGASDGWYVISNPLSHTSLTPTTTTYVTNLAPAAVASVPQFDLYKYSESNMNWYSYNAHQSSYYLTRGMGFLYARNEDATISFMSGTSYSLPVADVTPSLTYTAANGDMAGWNLLGNPFSHSITWDNIVATNVNTTGYYKLGNDGAWTADPSTTTAIKPMEGFLVKATAASPTLTIKNVAASSKGRANNDFLAFTVANSNYSDITYAMFSDGEGLEKINHRNTNVPMVYIPQDGERYAIATMGDDTEMFSLNFKAMTTGQYTLSYKAEGSFSYLHVIDRMTGEDIDMLIEDEYTFIGSPRDDENRFIVKLRYNANGNIGANDIFAYQSDDELIVSGEGTLQIFDVMGRFVGSYEVNGTKRISASQFDNAVYIFRLVGETVKTQKIVVR